MGRVCKSCARTFYDFLLFVLTMSPSLSADRARSISVVVLTTLGLGDIVPMTKASRLCVALEAITGITLAGYF